MEQQSSEWRQARKGRVTGSIAGAALGVDPNKSRHDAIRMLVREYHGKECETSEFLENVIFGYGRIHESVAILDFQMDSGIKTEECGFFPYEDWLGASPDALTSDGGVLEIKSPWSRRAGQGREFKSLDEQPHYYAQLQLEMFCTGRRIAHFYTWSAEKQTHEIVRIDHEWLDENLPRLKQFWADLQDAIKEPGDHLAPKRVTIDTPEAARMVREYDELCEQIELATERKKDLLADMVRVAGERNADFAGRKLTLTRKAGAVSYAKAIKALCPDADLEKWRGKPQEYWGLK